jgi:hypothetical protein
MQPKTDGMNATTGPHLQQVRGFGFERGGAVGSFASTSLFISMSAMVFVAERKDSGKSVWFAARHASLPLEQIERTITSGYIK